MAEDLSASAIVTEETAPGRDTQLKQHCVPSTIVLMVGGERFEIEDAVRLFGKYPDTMLGRMFAAENSEIFIGGRAYFEFPDRAAPVFHAILHMYSHDMLTIPAGVSPRLFWSEVGFWQVKPVLPVLPGNSTARGKHLELAERAAEESAGALLAQLDTYASFVCGDPTVHMLFISYLSPISNVVATVEVLRLVDTILLPECQHEIDAADSLDNALRILETRAKPQLSTVFRRISLLPKLSAVDRELTQRDTWTETISACIKSTVDYLELSNILAHSRYAQMLLLQRLAAADLEASFEVIHSAGGQVLPIFSALGDIQCTWRWVSSEVPVFNWVFDGEPGKDHTRRLVIKAKPMDLGTD